MSLNVNDPRLGILNIATLCGIQVIKKLSNEEIQAKCPFCGDSVNPRRGHLNLNIAKDSYRCVKCNEGGFAIGLYAKLSGISNKEAYAEIMDSKRVAINIPVPKVKQHKVAGLAIRDTVYRSLLDKLTLTRNHRQNLYGRGLDDFEVKNYKSLAVTSEEKFDIAQAILDEGHDIKGIPGFYIDVEDGRWTFIGSDGFLVPVLNQYDKIQGFQIRKDGNISRKYRWFSSKGMEHGTGASAWIGVSWNQAKSTKKIVITEGPLKAHVSSTLSNTTFVGVPGVGVYKEIPSLLQRMKGVESVPVAFDMDIFDNEQVKKSYDSLTRLLKENGYTTSQVTWNTKFKGIDDYLLSLAKRKLQRLRKAN